MKLKDKEFEIQLLYHKKKSKKTILVHQSKVNFQINELNKLLSENYYELNDFYSVKLYEDYYKNYYKNSYYVDSSNKVFKPINLKLYN